MHLRGRSAGVVWGGLALRRFSDWRPAKRLQSPLSPIHDPQTKHGSMAKTGAPGAPCDRRVGGFRSKTVYSDS
jgi:hypothetical protein